MTTTNGTFLVVLLVALCAAQANSSIISAATIRVTASSPTGEGPTLTVDLDTTVGDFTENEDGTSTWVGSLQNDVFDLGWDFFYDPDPGVSGNLSVTNNTDGTQLFSASTGVFSTIDVPAGTAMTGASTLSVADSDFSNTPATVMSPPGGAIFNGLITGTTERTLFPTTPPASFSLTALGNGVNVTFDSFAGETTSTALPNGGLLSLIHDFTLTAGDTATANSTFFVAPEPSGMALLLFGLIGAGLMRQRRAAK